MKLFTPGRRGDMFKRNPDQPPFFSIHPKTKIGMIIRVALSAFIILTLLLTLLQYLDLMLIWFVKLSYLIYVVPAFGIVALMLLGLIKRMPSTILKISVGAVLGLLCFSVLMTFASLFSYTSDFSLAPKMTIKRDGHTLVFMRKCDPEPALIETVENEDGTVTEVGKYLRRVDAFSYTARVPESVEGERYEIEGELYAVESAAISSDWIDERTLRVYISSDETQTGYGELFVRFSPSEQASPASPEASADQIFLKTLLSPDGARSVNVYREQSYIDHPVDSPLSVLEADLDQYFVAYPSVLRVFARIDTRVDGAILLKRHGTLAGFDVETIAEDIIRITPTQGSIDASGEITVYFNEKAKDAPAATPSESE